MMVPELRVMPCSLLKSVIRVVVLFQRHIVAKSIVFMVLSVMQCLLFAEVVFDLGDGVIVLLSPGDPLVRRCYVHLVVFVEIMMVFAKVPVRAMVHLLMQDVTVSGIFQVTPQILNVFPRSEMSGL